MKYRGKQGWLAIALSFTFLGNAALGLEGPSNLLRSLSHGFFMHGSQGYLGVDLRDVSASRAAELKLTSRRGVEVLTVDHDAPAAKAGLKVHDVIVQMDGQPIDGCDQMRRLLKTLPPGNSVTFVVSRDGAPLNITVQLADRALLAQQAWSRHFSVPEPDQQQQTQNGGESFVSGGSHGGSRLLGGLIPNSLYVGADVNPVHAQLAEYFGITSGTGLLVENVDDPSPASQAGLQAGDVILKVNSSPMISRNDWLKAIHDNRGKLVEVSIIRRRQQQTLTMVAGHSK